MNIQKVLRDVRSTIVFAIVAVAAMIMFAPVPAHGQNAEAEICTTVQNGTYDPDTGICTPEDGTRSLFGTGSIFEAIANTLLFLVGAISVIMLIIGGFRYVVSGGDANAVTGAKNTILYAIVGIAVAFLAFAAVNFVTNRL